MSNTAAAAGIGYGYRRSFLSFLVTTSAHGADHGHQRSPPLVSHFGSHEHDESSGREDLAEETRKSCTFVDFNTEFRSNTEASKYEDKKERGKSPRIFLKY
jgi:hypothetical protein